MDEKSFKKLLDEAINPVNESLDSLNKSVDSLKKDVNELKDVQENRLLPSIVELETTVKSYADSYKINKHNKVPHFSSE